MKRGIVVLALVGAAFFGGVLWQRRSAPAEPKKGERKILYWHDPMHPAYKSDKPGIAPDCGMQLEPVYADGGPASEGAGKAPMPVGAVSIAPGQQQLLGVYSAAVERAPSHHALRLFGRVTAEETRIFTVNAATEGSVRDVSSVTTGTRVAKGQWLGSIFSADARLALQAYITALDVQDRDPAQRREEGIVVAAGTTASRSAQFTVERLIGVGMSPVQIEEIRRKRDIPLLIKLYAPADGFVIARNISLGQKFDKGAEWFRIANLDKVWVVADVLGDEAPHVRPGMTAQIHVPGHNRTLPARVSDVLPQFDAASRSLKVRLEAENPGYLLRPDMFVDVELGLELPPAVTVPVDAIIDTGLRRTVFVEREGGVFEPRPVETGWRFGERVEVVKGLEPGERIVVSGTFLVDSESRMKAAAAGVHGVAAKDPICGMDVDEAKAKAAGKVHVHDGKTYYFCSEQCRSRFAEAPARHVASQAAR
jgi:multidrug efflux pump subunit AcrA (membrane-fusion protein)/YHS domain-containing protein